MLPAAEAWSRIESHLDRTGSVAVPRQASRGRCLARDLAATLDVPAHDVSAMDGYALAGPELADGIVLPVQETIAAGDAPGADLAPGHAARIMTGAPVPLRPTEWSRSRRPTAAPSRCRLTQSAARASTSVAVAK